MQILRIDLDRLGIRARLLTLLIPGVLGLDSWNDYRALRNLVQDGYDRGLLESVNALRGGIGLAPDGTLRLDAPPFVLQSLHGSPDAPQRHLHVGLTPSGATTDTAARPAEHNLLGETDLPPPPPPPPPLRPPLRAPLPPPMVMPGFPAVSTSAPTAPLVPITQPVWYDSHYGGQPVRLVALRSQVVDGHGQHFELLIQAAESTGPRDRTLAASSQQALFRDTRMVLVVILLVWLGVNWSLRPLERLRKSVLDSKGHELKPLDTSGVPHEVAPLVAAVNQYVASYRELLDQQSQFLADASHQLRTPLAIMMTQAGVALREKDPEQLRATLHAIVTQISRSRRLCEQLLSLAHASDTTSPVDLPERLNLTTVAKDVVLQYLTLAHEKNQDLGWEALPGQALSTDAAVWVLARGAELHETLSNLVHNAIVYTPPGGQITVMVGVAGGMAVAEVRDSGTGIAVQRRSEVFERFHHGGTSADKRLPGAHGAGLGLAIARAYARRNGGDIALADPAIDPGQTTSATGLRAILSLPLAPAESA